MLALRSLSRTGKSLPHKTLSPLLLTSSPSHPLSLSSTTWGSQTQRFLSYSSEEPEHRVQWSEDYIDTNDLQPAYLTDPKRMEMYAKHKSDPKEWSVRNISQRYGITLMRAKAVIYLMREREKMMKDLGVLNIPDKWDEIYTEHKSEPEVKHKEFLAEKYAMPLEEVEKILKNMGEHAWRKENLGDANDDADDVLDHLAYGGVNTTFKESSAAFVPGHINDESFYEPALFGDDDFEYMKEKIRDRLIMETKATRDRPKFGLAYEQRVQNWRKLFSYVPGLRNDPVELPPKTEAEEAGDHWRWKYAFKELKQRKKGDPPHPTVITMRDGRTRLANPLEELSRSWSKRPRGINASYGQERLVQYINPDHDDDKAKAISHADRIRREKYLRDNGLLKRK